MAKRVHVRLGIGIHVETRLAPAGAAECFWSSVRCASIKTVQNTQAASGRAKCVDKGGGKSAVKRSHCLPPLFEGKFFIAVASTQRDIILSMSHLNLSFSRKFARSEEMIPSIVILRISNETMDLSK